MRRDTRSVNRRVAAILGTTALTGGFLFAPNASAEPASTRAESIDAPVWGACPDGIGDDAGGPLECATVSVPLDYAEPDGDRIDIAVSRLPSSGPARRRGVLLLNPGGPGGPGLSMPISISKRLPESVRQRYDLIGFDPRGSGHSAQVACGITEDDREAALQPPYAHNDAEVADHARFVERVAERCDNNVDTLQHISTANTARDMDRIREALGERRISYYGVSYGTVLGAAYTSMYPRRSDRFVLDSAVGTAAMTPDASRRQGLGAEQTFPVFAAWVAERHATYRVGRTVAEVRRTFFDTAARLRERPVGGVSEDAFRVAIGIGSSDEPVFEGSAEYWRSIRDGDATATHAARRMLSETDRPVGRAADLVDGPTDPFLSSYLAVLCNDSTWSDDVSGYQRATRVDRIRYPLVGGSTANLMPCAYWPTTPEPPARVDPDGPSNVLILQNLRDAATPYVGGKKLRHRFGERARLVSADELGHGALSQPNACVLKTTADYLADGTFPPHDVHCPRDAESQPSRSAE